MNSDFLEKLMARRRYGMRPGLDAITQLLARLGNPQDNLKYVHVAGTNGKGATVALIAAALREAGLHVGRYTSPHLISINERFFIDDQPADDALLNNAASKVFAVIEKFESETGAEVTFFEALTAVAFLLFSNAKVDVVVLETGLGGRMDATNVIAPECVLTSVITRIGLDHCDVLGTTYVAIAEEKAGIIKPARPVVCAAMPPAAREVIARTASLNGSRFVAVEDYVSVGAVHPLILTTARRNLPPITFALEGGYQVENAMTALTVLDVLTTQCGIKIPDRAIVRGFERVVWPGRFQKIVSDGVTIYVDGAHNPDGAMALKESLKFAHVAQPIGLVAGFCGDKDVLAHLRLMSAVATRGWAVPIHNARSLDPAEVAERMQMAGFADAESCDSFAAAIARAKAWASAEHGTLVVCGSLFLAAEALIFLGAFPWQVQTEPDANELLKS